MFVKDPTFFISTLVPKESLLLRDILTSQRISPRLILASEMPIYWYTNLIYSRKAITSSLLWNVGWVTSSSSGMPARL